MTKLSIATVCLSGRLDEKLQAIAKAGFDTVEIFEADFLSYDGTASDVARLCADLGLKICVYQPLRDVEGMPEPQRTQNFARARKKFELMRELGTDLILVCSNVSPHALGGIDRAATDLRELGDLAASYGMRVGYEALAWGRHVSDYRDAWEVVRRANHASVGLVLDSFHTLAKGTPIDAIRTIPGDRIFLVQVADAPNFDLDVLSWSRHFRCFPGQGDLPVVAFMQAVEDTGYDGPISHEIFNDQFRAGSTSRVAQDGMRSLIDLSDKLGIADLPKRPTTRRIAFIEFAIDGNAAAQLRVLFAGLGFRKTGQHRRKSVERWSQGAINLIVNTDGAGFAHSHYITHGPGVCALGLDVEDVATAIDRARALKADPFVQAVGEGELEIAAIRGVGGSLIYFLEPKGPLGEVWEREFVPVEHAETSGYLDGIDHIAQSLPADEMLSWLLFYETIFDLKRLPQQDIFDPAGLVQSQALSNGSASVRVVINGTIASRTMSARFLSEFFGSGVQHIAFATDDIFAAVAEMRERGMTFLDIPENYYDDLDAKYSLPSATIAAMRASHILYDRDDNGEFFQIYTHLFAERFFIEIVQRRDYTGFGAANASIRLAAQSRERRLPAIPRR